MEQNIVLAIKRKFVFHFLSSLFFISAISLFEIGGIYSFINDKSKIGAFIQLISIFIAFLLFWRKKYIIPFDGMMRITYIFFLVICTFTVIRGICDPLPNWNLWSYLFNPFMLYMFLIPLVVLLPTPLVNLVYVSKISKFLLPFCIFYIITNFYELFSVQELMAMRSYDLMIIGQRSQIPSQILLPVLFFLPMTKNKAYKLAAVIVLIIATIALLLWGRRSCFVCTLLVALPFFYNMIRMHWKLSLSILGSIIIYLVAQCDLEYFVQENFEVLYERYDADTRSDTEWDFYKDMDWNDWLLGRGMSGTYKSPSAAADDVANRSLIETGYLHLILKGGILLLIPYLIILINSVYKGFFQTKNKYIRLIAYYIFINILFLYPGGHTGMNLPSFMLWTSVAICQTRSIRHLTDEDMECIFKI